MKLVKKILLKVGLICLLLNFSNFQGEAFASNVYETNILVTNNLLGDSSTSSKVSKKELESNLSKSEKGIKRVQVGYAQNGLDSLPIKDDSPGLSTVEFKYNTRASVRNINYLMDSVTVHTLKSAMNFRDSLLILHNQLLYLHNDLLNQQNDLKKKAQMEKTKVKKLEAKAHLVILALFILSILLFGISKWVDYEDMQRLSSKTSLITFVLVLWYIADYFWLLSN